MITRRENFFTRRGTCNYTAGNMQLHGVHTERKTFLHGEENFFTRRGEFFYTERKIFLHGEENFSVPGWVACLVCSGVCLVSV